MGYLKFDSPNHLHQKISVFALCLFIFSSLFIFCSCEGNLDINIPAFEKKLAIEACLYDNDNVLVVKLSQSRSPYTKLRGYLYDTLYNAHGAEIELNNNGIKYSFMEDTGKYFPKRWYAYSAVSYYICENNSKLNGNADLHVKFDGKEYFASAVFPEKPKIISAMAQIEKDESAVYWKNLIHASIKLASQEGIKNYYRITITTEYDYGYGNYKTTASQGNTEFFYIKNDAWTKPIEFKYPLYQSTGTKYKSIMIVLEHISEEYSKFLDACKTQIRRDDSPLGTEGTEIPSSFKDGYGIFACISRDTVCIKLD